MANDFFRRLVMFSPEITREVEQNGTLTLPTMTAIMGANPNTITNPSQARAVQNRISTAERYRMLNTGGTGTQMGQSAGMDFPNFMSGFNMPSMSNFARGTGRFISELAGQVANFTYGPFAKPILDKMFDWSGLSSMLSHQPQLGPSSFLPEYLGGTGEAYDDPLSEEQFNMTAPENLRNVGPDGQPATGLGTYRGGAGFVTGTMSPGNLATKDFSYSGFLGGQDTKPSQLDRRAQRIRR